MMGSNWRLISRCLSSSYPRSLITSRSCSTAGLSSHSNKVVVEDAETFERTRASDSFFSTSIFHDELVNKFVNCMMWDGKKILSRNILKKTFIEIKTRQLRLRETSKDPTSIEINPLAIFHKAIENAKPIVGIQTMHKGGKNFPVPTPLTANRRQHLAIKWTIHAARKQNVPMTVNMYERLAKEFLDCYNHQGTVIQRKQELHKQAETNRAYANYRWW